MVLIIKTICDEKFELFKILSIFVRLKTKNHIGKSPSQILDVLSRIFLQNLGVGCVKAYLERLFILARILMVLVLMCNEIICRKNHFFKKLGPKVKIRFQKVHFEYLVHHVQNIVIFADLVCHLVKVVAPYNCCESLTNQFLQVFKILNSDVSWFILVLKLIIFCEEHQENIWRTLMWD